VQYRCILLGGKVAAANESGGQKRAKPSTEQCIAEMLESSTLEWHKLYTASVDVIYFLWHVARRNGKILIQFPDDKEARPVEITVPGLFKLSM
jgi:hypothetical protein